MKSSSLRWVGLGIGLASCLAVAWYATQVMGEQDWSAFWSPGALLGLAWAGLMYGSIVPLSSIAWKGLLNSMGHSHDRAALMRVLAVSQMAKYIPGNVANHVSRAALVAAQGVPMAMVVSSMVVETLLAIAAALGVAALGVVLEPSLQQALGRVWSESPKALPLALAGVLLVVVAVGWRFAKPDLRPSFSTGVKALAIYVLNYLLLGVGLWGFACLAIPEHAHHGMVLASAFSLAWVVGLFTPGAPAGLGVREGLMLLFLAPFYHPAAALFLVVGFRLATLVTDLLWFAWGSWTGWKALQFKRKTT
jgi:hypothetical protein